MEEPLKMERKKRGKDRSSKLVGGDAESQGEVTADTLTVNNSTTLGGGMTVTTSGGGMTMMTSGGEMMTTPGRGMTMPPGGENDKVTSHVEVKRSASIDMNKSQLIDFITTQLLDLSKTQLIDVPGANVNNLHDANKPQQIEVNKPQQIDVNKPQQIDVNKPQQIDMPAANVNRNWMTDIHPVSPKTNMEEVISQNIKREMMKLGRIGNGEEGEKGESDKEESDKGESDMGDSYMGESDKEESDKEESYMGESYMGESYMGESDKGDSDKGENVKGGNKWAPQRVWWESEEKEERVKKVEEKKTLQEKIIKMGMGKNGGEMMSEAEEMETQEKGGGEKETPMKKIEKMEGEIMESLMKEVKKKGDGKQEALTPEVEIETGKKEEEMIEALNQETQKKEGEMKEALKKEGEMKEALNKEREMKEAAKKEREMKEALNKEREMKEALNKEREMKEALKREKEINEALNQEREMKEALKKEKEINEALNQETQKKEADNSTQINTTPALSVISISFKGSETQETPTEGTSGEDSPQDSSECVVLQQKIRELQHDRLGLESQVSTLQAALDTEREKLDKNHQEYTQIISEQEKEIHNLKINMLFKAVWKCDGDTVRKLRKGDFNFNSAVNLDGERVVDEAVRQSNVAVLRELLLGGVHINAPNSRGDTPLHTAIRRGRYCKVISELHNSGADWRAPDARGWDPLQLATALGQIKTLEISIRDESINLTSVIDRLGSTLLHYAAANKQKEMAKWLVKEQGLQKDIEDEMGYQAKDYAAMVGESGLAQWLSSDKLRHIPVVKRLSVHSRQKQDQLALDQLRVHDEMDLQGIGTLTRNTGMLNISTDALNVSTGMQTRDTSTPNRLSSGSIGTPTASLDMLAAPRGKNKTHARGRKKGQAPSLSSSTTEVSYLSNRQDSLNGPITVAQTHHRKNEGQGRWQNNSEDTDSLTNFTEFLGAEEQTILFKGREMSPDIEDLRISGLPNLGNTCYINSVLQCLYHTHLLTQHFITGKYSKEIDETAAHDGRVAKAYERVIRAMWTGDNIKDHLQNLKELAGRLDDLFLDDQQKEAHDFLTQVLEWLHLDLGQEVVTSNKEEEEEMLRNNRGRPMLRSFISELFYGCQHNSIVCGRNGQVICHSEESFSNLTLYVNTKKQYSLNELLKQYYRQQDIVWECDYCGEEHMCLQHSVITSPPRLLLLYINRVNEDTKSSHKTLVTYPECDLSLHPYTKDNHSPSYNLYAVCGHQGSMTSGHYTAFCKIKSSTSKGWYYFSDANFSRANTQDVFFNPDAHMLFYEAK